MTRYFVTEYNQDTERQWHYQGPSYFGCLFCEQLSAGFGLANKKQEPSTTQLAHSLT